ncbi:hypothetical protein, partial [Methyloceanibacter marginalis]|uniref:hypothetical protein n=1 Tax=Methyloceanibacter marginalis TaxID=1774971 RepID=UPI00195685F8
ARGLQQHLFEVAVMIRAWAPPAAAGVIHVKGFYMNTLVVASDRYVQNRISPGYSGDRHPPVRGKRTA